jgi:hypothetical protein
MLRSKNKTVLILDSSEFNKSHTSELLAHLEDIEGIRKGNTLKFSARTEFRGLENIKVIHAFNIYLRQLSMSTDVIIINNI